MDNHRILIQIYVDLTKTPFISYRINRKIQFSTEQIYLLICGTVISVNSIQKAFISKAIIETFEQYCSQREHSEKVRFMFDGIITYGKLLVFILPKSVMKPDSRLIDGNQAEKKALALSILYLKCSSKLDKLPL